MAEEGKIGIGRALLRFLVFWNWRKARGILRAADEQFTGSTGGIRDAFDIHQDTLVTQYQSLEEAVGEVEMVLEEKRIDLENLNNEQEELIGKREGALAKIEAAQEAGDNDALAKHTAAFGRFDNRINEIEARQEVLAAVIAESEENMKGFLQQLTDMQAEIGNLPRQKAEAIADFVSSSKIIELNNRLKGIQTSVERGPIDAVLAANKKLTAQARVSNKLAGTDVRRQDEEYAAAGRSSVSGDRLGQMLAARKAEKAAKTGAPEDSESEERPKI